MTSGRYSRCAREASACRVRGRSSLAKIWLNRVAAVCLLPRCRVWTSSPATSRPCW